MKHKIAAAIFSVFAAVSLNAEVLWQADFNQELAGFKVNKKGLNDSAKVENGELVLTFNHGMYKGLNMTQEIPCPDKGEISFDAAVNVGKERNYTGFGLQFFLFGRCISWNGIKSTVQIIQNGSKWTTFASGVPAGQMVNYRFRFDRTNKTLDVFYDGAMFPTMSFKDIAFKEPVNGKGAIGFGNYGFPKGTIINKISNIKLESVSGGAELEEARVVWSEKFEKDGSLEENGYQKIRDNKKDSFTVKDGVLTAVCQNSPYRGTVFKKSIPGLIRGELSFEANVGNGNGYNHYSLTMKVGTLTMAFRAERALHVYHPKTNKWASVTTSKMSRGDWHKILVRFDAESHVTEYFIDDMTNPVFIDMECNYEVKRNLLFELSNYGLCNGTITNHIRNIELKEIPKKKSNSSNSLSGIKIYRGFSDCHWKLPELCQKLGEANVAEYVVTPHGAHTDNKNNRFNMEPKPSPNDGLAKYIILADMPASPIPEYAQKHIISSVENGGKLIILGGLFTLQKGDFKGTELEKILPVSLKEKWNEDPAAIPGAKVQEIGSLKVISKSLGKGMVYVFPGNVIKDPSLADALLSYQF